jgi:hypothetical protein
MYLVLIDEVDIRCEVVCFVAAAVCVSAALEVQLNAQCTMAMS